MCTKHHACRSNKVALNPSHADSCSSPKIASIKMEGVESATQDCCTSTGCSSGVEPIDEDTDPKVSAAAPFTHSWKIDGMDCPSCARKIETAVNKVEGVLESQVLFTTQKLVVNANHSGVAQLVEKTIIDTGFSFSDFSSAYQNDQPSGWKSILVKNKSIIAIAASMAFATAIKPTMPQVSEWLFIVTCLIGLYPIGKKALSLAKSGTPFAIETLMSVAALGALYLGETAEAAMVLLLFLIGEQLEAFAAHKARSGVQALMALVPDTATKISGGQRIEVSASELQPDDIIEVSPGGRLPADGRLMSSTASFDESALTGESLPIERSEGDNVMAGAVVVDRVVRFTITSKQGENAIDRILHLIEEAESRKAPLERFLDKFSRWYTPLMMLVALVVIVVEDAAELGIEAATVLVPCGGGGLTSGIALACAGHAPGLNVRPCEPEGFDDVRRSLISGGRERNNRMGGSICDAIVTPSPGEITFPLMQAHCGAGLAVSEDDCLRAMALAFEHLKVIIEPGGAVALAAALYHPDEIDGDTVICVASGGNVDAAMFQRALDMAH